MIKSQLREFIERVVDTRTIAQRRRGAVSCRDRSGGTASAQEGGEAEALLSLERALAAPERFRVVLSALVVVSSCRGSRPTGRVTGRDDAVWLAATLDIGGPNPTGMRIAEAVAAEAEPGRRGARVGLILRGRQEARGASRRLETISRAHSGRMPRDPRFPECTTVQ